MLIIWVTLILVLLAGLYTIINKDHSERKVKQDKLINELRTSQEKKSKKKTKASDVALPNSKPVANLIGDVDPFETLANASKNSKKQTQPVKKAEKSKKEAKREAKKNKAQKAKLDAQKESKETKDSNKKVANNIEEEVFSTYADAAKVPPKQVSEQSSKKKNKKNNKKQVEEKELVTNNTGSVMTSIAPTEEISLKDNSGFTTVGEKKQKQKQSNDDGWSVVGGETRPTTSTMPTLNTKRRSVITSKPKTFQKSSHLVYNPYNTEADFWNSEVSTQHLVDPSPDVEEESTSTFPNIDNLVSKKSSVTIKMYSAIPSEEHAWNTTATSPVVEDDNENPLDEEEFPSFGLSAESHRR